MRKIIIYIFVLALFFVNFSNIQSADSNESVSLQKSESSSSPVKNNDIQKNIISWNNTSSKRFPKTAHLPLKDWCSTVSLPDRSDNVAAKNQANHTSPSKGPPNDYFYEINLYSFDGDGDGYNDSVVAEFDSDTSASSDYITVVGGLFDSNDTLVDGPKNISYQVLNQEADYQYLNFTAFYNGSSGSNDYYLYLVLYDSYAEADDEYLSSTITLFVNPYDYFYECGYRSYDSNGDGYNDSIQAAFDVDTLQTSDCVMVIGGLFDSNDTLIDEPKSISYWVFDQEADYHYLNFSAVFNGSSGLNGYYVILHLYDSLLGEDDYNISSSLSLTLVANWTFMVYLDGDNNLELYGILDFLEMSSVGSDRNMSIVVEFDRTPGHDTRYDDWKTTKRYYVTQDMVPDASSALMDIGEADMGDPQTLIDFVEWTTCYYPAHHYNLVLWNHGSGWKKGDQLSQKGVCNDDTSGSDIDSNELKYAMNTIKDNLGKNIDILGFDACLMGMIEVDYQLHNTVDIIVGSEEIVPGDGWPYDAVLSYLDTHPASSSSNFAAVIVNDYMSSYGFDNELTIAAFNISGLTNDLVPKVNSFAQKLIENLGTYYPEVLEAKKAAQYYSYSFYRDLYDFAYEITQRVDNTTLRNSAQDVMDAMNNSCVAEAHGSFTPGSHGLSIYFENNEGLYADEYETLDFAQDTYWNEFLLFSYTDAYEPDDVYTASSAIVLNGPSQIHNFHDAGDHDWITFDAVAGIRYIIETADLGPDSDTYLFLYDHDGTTVLFSNDDSGGGLASRIIWTCPATGAYYAMVRQSDDITHGPTAYYHLAVLSVPYADFIIDPASSYTRDLIYFNDTSVETNGEIVNWTWDFGDGTISYQQNTTHQYTDNGTYLITLNVTNNVGASNKTSQTLTVLNVRPIPNFTYIPLRPTNLQIIQFTDSSTDSDGTVAYWTWNFGDGTAVNHSQNPTHQYIDNGTYLITLNITDDDGTTNETNREITVLNVPPIANFSYSPMFPTVHEVITFTDTSTDSDGSIVSWSWDFGDGNISLVQHPTHTYLIVGNYTVTLTVADDDGTDNSSTRQITVTSPSIPFIINEYPTNNSISIQRPPAELHITIGVPKGNSIDVSLRWKNHSGQWYTLQTYTSVGNGTYNFILPTANDWIWGNTTYLWSVNVTDGTSWANETYSFTTGGSRYDVNNNGLVNFQDAGLVWTHRTSLVSYDGLYDVNQDGKVNFQDTGLTWMHRD